MFGTKIIEYHVDNTQAGNKTDDYRVLTAARKVLRDLPASIHYASVPVIWSQFANTWGIFGGLAFLL